MPRIKKTEATAKNAVVDHLLAMLNEEFHTNLMADEPAYSEDDLSVGIDIIRKSLERTRSPA